MAKLKYGHIVAEKMTNEIPEENVCVATATGVFVIPRRFLPQVLEGVDEVARTIADSKDSQAS